MQKICIQENSVPTVTGLASHKIKDAFIMLHLLNPGLSEEEIGILSTKSEEFDLLTEIKEKEMLDIFEIEKSVAPVLQKMHETGIKVDKDRLEEMRTKAQDELAKVAVQLKIQLGDINLNSPKQVLNKLKQLKILDSAEKSVNAEVLKAIVSTHPVIPLLLRYREVQKLLSGSIEPCLKHLNPVTSKIQSCIRQFGAETGRMSYYDQNLQALSGHIEGIGDIHNCFIPSQPGYVFIEVDYKAIELVLLLILSKEPLLTESYLNNEDLHKKSASAIFNVGYDDVTDEQRTIAKQVTYAILYGAGAGLVAGKTGKTKEESQQFIDTYFKKFPVIKEFQQRLLNFTRQTGYAYSIYGRRRCLPEINSTDYSKMSLAERQALNMPLQSSSSDIMKLALVKLDHMFTEEYASTVRLLLTVHDYFLVECPAILAKEVSSKITEVMINTLPEKFATTLPLRVDLKVSKYWKE